MKIDAAELDYRALNARVRAAMEAGERELVIENARGQRYIGTGITCPQARIEILGVPGNVPEATGARGPRVLGSLTPGR